MSGAVFTLGNSVSGSLSLGSALSKFGRVAGQSGFTIEQDEETLNNTVTSRYAGLAAVTVSGVTSVLNPSLVLIPSAYNTSGSTGILYSLHSKPNGVADFVVTRATEGTRFNSVGRISTVGSGDARLDYYTSGGTAGTPALLVEPAATNVLSYSEEFDNAAWGKSAMTVSTGTTAAFTAPDGTTNADKIIATSGNVAHNINRSGLTSAAYTFSVFAKAGEESVISLWLRGASVRAEFNLVSGTVSNITTTSARIENYGNGWYRCTVYDSTAGTTAHIYGREGGAYAGNGSDGFYLWGAQIETGSVATSYIPTTTAPITRNADVINLSGAVSGCIGQSEGTIYWEGAINRIDRVFFALASGASTTQNIRLQGSSAGLMQFVVQSGATQAIIGTSGAITLGQFYKVAVAYKQDDFVFYVNGQKVGEDNSGTIPTNLNSVYFLNPNGTEITDQRCRAAALYTTRLTNAELQSLTTL